MNILRVIHIKTTTYREQRLKDLEEQAKEKGRKKAEQRKTTPAQKFVKFAETTYKKYNPKPKPRKRTKKKYKPKPKKRTTKKRTTKKRKYTKKRTYKKRKRKVGRPKKKRYKKRKR